MKTFLKIPVTSVLDGSGNQYAFVVFIWKHSESIKMATDSAVWTEDEAELLLNVTLEYKTTKVSEGLD